MFAECLFVSSLASGEKQANFPLSPGALTRRELLLTLLMEPEAGPTSGPRRQTSRAFHTKQGNNLKQEKMVAKETSGDVLVM
jgi:hypothetical protein